MEEEKNLPLVEGMKHLQGGEDGFLVVGGKLSKCGVLLLVLAVTIAVRYCLDVALPKAMMEYKRDGELPKPSDED